MLYLIFPQSLTKSSSSQKPYPWEQEAKVILTIEPNEAGRVKFRGSYWNARCLQPVHLAAGTKVKVTGIAQITLIVEPYYYPLPEVIKIHAIQGGQFKQTTKMLRGDPLC